MPTQRVIWQVNLPDPTNENISLRWHTGVNHTNHGGGKGVAASGHPAASDLARIPGRARCLILGVLLFSCERMMADVTLVPV